MYAERKLSHNWLIKKLINNRVRERLPSISGIVLDFGCGVRPFEQDILRYTDTYIGVDWNHSLHQSAADVIADLNKALPFGDGCADHVVSFEVLEHLAEPGIMLHEAFRVLRSGGEFTLSTPFQWWVHEAPWDYQRFTRYGLEYQLNKAGFTNIKVIPTSGFWSMWALKFNYQMERIARGKWWWRLPARALLTPLWLLNQLIAVALDRVWHEERETVGYFVIAKKP